MKKYIKNVIIVFVILIIILISTYLALIYKNNKKEYTHKIGNYGVLITVPKEFKKYDINQDSQLLNLQNDKITISVTELKGDFWSSGDLNVINDEYIKLISSSMYDRSVSNVEHKIINVDGEDVGQVSMEISKNITAKKTITLLTQKTHGYLAIEFYGNTKDVNDSLDIINSIIKNIKFSDNKHNYDRDIPKEFSEEEIQHSLHDLYELIGLNESGEFIMDSGETIIYKKTEDSSGE